MTTSKRIQDLIRPLPEASLVRDDYLDGDIAFHIHLALTSRGGDSSAVIRIATKERAAAIEVGGSLQRFEVLVTRDPRAI